MRGWAVSGACATMPLWQPTSGGASTQLLTLPLCRFRASLVYLVSLFVGITRAFSVIVTYGPITCPYVSVIYAACECYHTFLLRSSAETFCVRGIVPDLRASCYDSQNKVNGIHLSGIMVEVCTVH